MKSWNESGLNRDYLGWSPENDFVVINMTRGSILSRVNFEGVRDRLLGFAEQFGIAPERSQCGGLDRDESDWVYIHKTNHFLCGWIDWVFIRSDAPAPIIQEAEKCLANLADYPVWDEDRYYSKQWNAICDYWDGLGLQEKIDYCKEAGLSCFAARRFPDSVMESFYDNPDFG